MGRRTQLAVSDRCWAWHLFALEHSIPRAALALRRARLIGPLRAVKDAHEVVTLLAAGAAADQVAAALLAGEIPLVGRTEAEVSYELSGRLRDAGHTA